MSLRSVRHLLNVSFCVIILSICVAQQIPHAITVSMVQLIAAPDEYDGKTVTVKGFFSSGREGDGLFLGKADYENVVLENSIWIRRPDPKVCDAQKLDQRYVEITGVFKKGFREQLGNPPSGIPHVISCRFWSDPNRPLVQRLGELHKRDSPE